MRRIIYTKAASNWPDLKQLSRRLDVVFYCDSNAGQSYYVTYFSLEKQLTINYENDLLLFPRFSPLGGVSGLNARPPEFSVLGILPGDPQFLHVPSDALHPSYEIAKTIRR